MPDQNWQFELEEYIKQGEPDRAEKSEAWQTAIGLQAVDGLNTSAYLLDTAKDHIEGKITIDEAQQRIHSYYEQRTTRTEIENETKEADIVSARIAKLLGEKTFQFSPAEWITIHRRLFEGVFDHAGQIRKYNISKKEWILNGETVIYADFNSIKDTLDYDFATEKQFSYEGLSVEASVKHLAKFASDIWQIHPFGEGNTRATAVFMIKYMKTFGFRVNNDAFRENSWYFRNALVRANYNDLQKGIHSTTKFLELFFSNLLLGTNYELKNRYMHVDSLHDEIKEKLVAIGELLGFDSRSEVKITTGAVVDAVWEAKIGNMGKAIYVFEVQSKGSIDSLILNLKKAQSNAAVQAVVAVADEEQLAKIIRESAGVIDEKSLRTWDSEDVLAVYDSLVRAHESINKLALVPESF